MKPNLKHLMNNNSTLKIISLFLGYTFWVIFSQSYKTNVSVTVPLCFYNNKEFYQIEAPETLKVILHGQRHHFYNLDKNHLALHINSKDLVEGKNQIKITEENLFLPGQIKLVECNPSNLVVNVTLKKEQSS